MPRISRGVVTKRRHKSILNRAKGFRGRRKNVFRVAKQAVLKAQSYATRDRKVHKRVMRALWIARINAAARAQGLNYSQFIYGLQQIGIELDRKALANLALNEPESFTELVQSIQQKAA